MKKKSIKNKTHGFYEKEVRYKKLLLECKNNPDPNFKKHKKSKPKPNLKKKDKIYSSLKQKNKVGQLRVKFLKKRATIYELMFKAKLEAAGIKFIFQKLCIAGNFFCIADFYLPRPYKLIIEIDGEYHETEEQKKKDKYKNLYYRNRGFRVKRIKNKDVESFDVTTLIKQQDAKYLPRKKL